MSDVVVTVPMGRWEEWVGEGAAPGESCPPDTHYFFTVSGHLGRPRVEPGDRVYVVAHGKLRGYAPLVRLDIRDGQWALIREGGAVAVTLPEQVRGFRGFKYRWWDRAAEIPFPDWRTP